MDTKIKICGLTNPAEVEFLADRNVKYAGIVMFYEKSRRNNSPETAKPIISALKELEKNGIIIEKVAVTVSPTLEQLKIIQKLGFDIIQIHGELKDEVVTNATIPIFRAYNLSSDLVKENLIDQPKIKGILFDGKVPGGGKKFDWSLLKKFDKKDKLIILAGGLDESNVADGIKEVSPDIVDVSSGVEYLDEGKAGKDPERIKAFINAVVQTK
ncbi:phosphoribosylanthranilate isomerase [[Clostridium] fimetarium]|uniref:N-(5'-phosphoribosyl)anthranilate isomerase n=1 Tax=[Clostridium] fimetarium TaxID=99656 RepID=A0A1I0R9N1_9FIRM|nr:phosphoribosylanthranilate isomerase [[Clostridium] fimetarium]SEW37284.1 phosphoribosylanthranilate isomerase [[Clostridium] fimetarium]